MKIKSKKTLTFFNECADLKICLGGGENIDKINRCSTRIRITVFDLAKINFEQLQKNSVFNQYLIKEHTLQFLIPKQLDEVFIALIHSLNLRFEDIPNTFEVRLNRTKTSFFKWLTDGIGLIINPIIPLLITLAIVSTLANIFTGIDSGTGTLADQNATLKVVGNILKTLQNGVTLAFSILIPWAIFKLMKASEAIGITIGVVLCGKDLFLTQDVINVINPPAGWDQDLPTSFTEIAKHYPWRISYEGQILPIVGMAFMGVYLERFVMKYMNYPVLKEMLSIPLVTIVTFLVGMLVVGPAGLYFTYGLNLGIRIITTHPIAKYVFNPLFGIILPWLVVTGFIQVFVVLNMQQFTNFGGTTIMPMFTQLNVAVATSLLALMVINHHNKELRKNGIPSCTLAYVSGSTESALFGVTLRFVYPVIAASIGAAVGIIFTTFGDVVCTLGIASLLVFLSITTDGAVIANMGISAPMSGGPYLWTSIAILATIITTLLATFGLSRLKKFKTLNQQILESDFSVQ